MQDRGIFAEFKSMRGALELLLNAQYVVQMPGQSVIDIEILGKDFWFLGAESHQTVNVYALTHRASLEDFD